MGFWRSKGGALLMRGGALINCSECPCTHECERQEFSVSLPAAEDGENGEADLSEISAGQARVKSVTPAETEDGEPTTEYVKRKWRAVKDSSGSLVGKGQVTPEGELSGAGKVSNDSKYDDSITVTIYDEYCEEY